jgi:hypothetical protein
MLMFDRARSEARSRSGHHLPRVPCPGAGLADRGRVSTRHILHLQSLAGNRAVGRLLSSDSAVVAQVRDSRLADHGETPGTAGSDPPHPMTVVQRHTRSTATKEEHERALQNHREDREALKEEVARMSGSTDTLTRNTARWFKEGMSRLCALTPTADTAARVSTVGKEPSLLAMFGGSHDVGSPDMGTYNTDDMEDVKGVEFVPRKSGGFRDSVGGRVCITQPARRADLNALLREQGEGTLDPVSDALKHETQHEADIYFTHEYHFDARTPADRALATYRTEFRAYSAQRPSWLEGELTEKETERLKALGLTGHQWAGGIAHCKLFVHIVSQYTDVNRAWRANDEVREGGCFRDVVLATHGDLGEISANPTNSPEVSRLWRLINTASVQPSNWGELITAAKAVAEPDRMFILSAEPRWRGWLRKRWQVDEVRNLLGGDFTRVGAAHDAAARAKAERKAAASREKVRSEAPQWDVLEKRFSSWNDVRGMLETKGLLTEKELIRSEFEEWSVWDWGKLPVEAFFGNTFHAKEEYDLVNWWDRLGL